MTDRNIVDLARRVLGADKVGRDLNNAASWDAIELVLENAPDLARAVIVLTAKVERVEALADEMDREADRIHVRYMDMGDHAHGLRDAYREDAKRIRATLNEGGDR